MPAADSIEYRRSEDFEPRQTASSTAGEQYTTSHGRTLRFYFPLTLADGQAESGPANSDAAESCLEAPYWNFLPSSLEQKSSRTSGLKNSAPKTAASVVYQVKVQLRLGATMLAEAVRKVHIFDCKGSTPPLCLRDFAPEYICQQASVIRKNILQKTGIMSVEVDQPAPLVFVSSGGAVTTRILLKVSLRTISDASGFFAGGTFEAEITWRLRSSTFVSMQMLHALPTVREAALSKLMAYLATSSPRRRLKMIWSDWTPTNPQSQTCSGSKTEWTAIYPIWLSIHSTPALAPTFSLPYLSRRYSILLHVSVSGLGRSQTSLTLPVQITYRSEALGSTRSGEAGRSPSTIKRVVSPFQARHEGDDAPLPLYIA